MLDWSDGTDTDFECATCGAEITLWQYRRKVPLCDDCLVDEEMRILDDGEARPQ